MSVVGWYVHHHGHGHRTRFEAVRPHVAAEVVVLSSLPRPRDLPDRTTWVELPRDDGDEGRGSPAEADPTAGGVLHWAPVGHRGHAERLATIARHAVAVDAMVVDVSVEVTALARLLGRRVVLVAQPGDRTDAPHALGRSLAEVVVAPWPSGLDDEDAGIEHVGGISRFAGVSRPVERVPGTVLALGAGATDPAWDAELDAAEAATPGWRWQRIGGASRVDDPWEAIAAAEVVVTAAGQNAVADVAAADARAIVVPRPRPFAEQHATADRLRGLDLAIVPDEGAAWPDLLERARALEPDWSRWQVAGAAERAAAVVDRTAEGAP